MILTDYCVLFLHYELSFHLPIVCTQLVGTPSFALLQIRVQRRERKK